MLLASVAPPGVSGGGPAGLWAPAEYLSGEVVAYITLRPDIAQSSQRASR